MTTHKKQIKKARGNSGTGRSQEKIVVIADDFTGANDTGVQFCKKNLKSIVITDSDNIIRSLKYCDVLVIDTESRFNDPEKAYNKTFKTGKILLKENIKYFYKKLDSTFRGNIGAEISGLMDSLELKFAILVPAFPSNRRTTKNGMVYVDDVLLAETEISKDPRTPVKESFIPDIVSQQTDKKIEIINSSEVLKGKAYLSEKLHALMDKGTQIIVVDALDDHDLDLIASVTAPLKERILFTGSPGFAQFLPKYMDISKEKGIGVIIAGSVSEVTRRQIEYATKRLPVRLIDVETEKLFNGEQSSEKKRIMAGVREALRNSEDVVVRSAPSAESVSGSVKQGQNYGLQSDDVSEIISQFLGDIASDIIRKIRIYGILLTGGDTAIKTARTLKISGTIIHDEIQPGIPYGQFIGERYKNIIVVTKAGGFGTEDAIFQTLTFFKKSLKNE